MQFLFFRRVGDTWRLKSSIRRVYAGVLCVCLSPFAVLILSADGKGWFAPILIAAFCALTLLGVYWLASGVTVVVDFQRRVFRFRGGLELPFDRARGLLVTTFNAAEWDPIADLPSESTWYRLWLLIDERGEELRNAAKEGRSPTLGKAKDSALLLAATWRDIDPVAEDLAEALGVELVDVLKIQAEQEERAAKKARVERSRRRRRRR